MKTVILLLAVCFVGIYADSPADEANRTACLTELGLDLNKSEYSSDESACVLNCILKKENKDAYNYVKNKINNKEDLLQTLNKCKEQAGDNGCELLKCIRFAENPFNQYV